MTPNSFYWRSADTTYTGISVQTSLLLSLQYENIAS